MDKESNSNNNQQQSGGQWQAEQNKIEHHKIELPKGGGAIRGIEEKFQANAVTGTGSFTVPLPITPGRSGFAPQLTLGYNSGSGAGEYGLGWGVDIPSITRKTDKELPQYKDDIESDTFVLSGAEDLVPLLKKQGTKWQRRTWEETVEEDGESITYTVYPYRPRIEGLFAKIERWENKATRKSHWQATTKENITSIYGKSSNARVANPDYPRFVYQWLIEKSYDAKGNSIIYQYKEENFDNVETLGHESNRLSNIQSITNRYLKRVKYSPFAGNSDRYHFQLVFDFGEHTTDTPDEAGKWNVRQDPFSSYKGGFEIRTYRLCKRVLMFHNFTKGEDDIWELVKTTELYHEESATMTYLKSAVQKGYKKSQSGYETKTLPPLEFEYTKLEIDETIHRLDEESLGNLPSGLNDNQYQWVDLEGEGLSGIVIYDADQLYYKQNEGDAKFGAMKALKSIPRPLSAEGGLQITDINGDGEQELVVRSSTVNGYFEYKDGKWENYEPFKTRATVDFSDHNVKTIDLNGDGIADLIVSENHAYRSYYSRGKEGYEAGERRQKALDENKGPALAFADSTQSIYLADMSGDGLTDIVRIRNGEVCYWPNLGYGRFGAKVDMSNAPQFSILQEKYNPQYIKLGDIDGSGTTDIFYFGNGRVEYWLNESGNSFSDKKELAHFLPVDNMTGLSLIDLKGTGTLSLVWSTQRPGMQEHQMSYIELMKEKPHLLSAVNNNMGKVTRIYYASSTRYYIEDRASGKPWITKLPFPVHTLARVETMDLISGSRLVSEYKYHHGYYDTAEREFRGFGMVETVDTETHMPPKSPGGGLGEGEHYVAPVLTKTWFHTGAFIKAEKISRQYEEEYYRGDENAFYLPDTVIDEKEALDPVGLREAYRALKNSALRQEIYEYGKDIPYQVTEANFNVKTLQPKEENKHAVFFAHPLETLTYHYEQNKDDPRIGHEMNLEVDEYGNIKKSTSIVYPRRVKSEPQINTDEHSFFSEVKTEQLKPYVTVNTNEFINETGDFYLIGVPSESTSYEVNAEAFGIRSSKKAEIDEVRTHVANSLANPIPSDQEISGSGYQSRLINRSKNYFWNENQNTPLPCGDITGKALMHHTAIAGFTLGMVSKAYGTDVTDQMLTDAGYVFDEDHWWNPGLTQHYSQGDFYLPVKTTDPFGGEVNVVYDEYKFIPVKTIDSLGNTTESKVDYRTLQPWQMTDPNGNRSEAVTDPMGMVMATSVYGTEQGENRGDTPLFDSNGDPIYQIQSDANIENVLNDPAKYLQEATTFFYYDLDAWTDRNEPPQSIMTARETHVRDLADGEITKIQKTIAYSDGYGRELQTKIMVEPGLAWVKYPDDTFKEEWSDPRWLVSGRTVYNNKQKPVKQYEPFYSASHTYEPEEFFAEYGVTPIIHYDPLLRVVRTDTPKGFFSKVEFNPWMIERFDENDTVKDSEYYDIVINQGGIGLKPQMNTDERSLWLEDEKEALLKAEEHYNTPQVSILDTLGREFMSITYLKDIDQATEDDRLVTYTKFNITGKPLAITDPRQYAEQSGVKTFQYTYNMNDQVTRTINIDAGDDRVLNNILGNPVFSMDKKGHQISISYDLLQRPVNTHVTGNGLNNITEQLIYGESQPNAEENNLRGQLYQHYDQSGLNQVSLYSFKGEPVNTSKQIRSDYKNESDWQDGADWNSLLESEVFTTATKYDALGRIKHQYNPDQSEVEPEFHQSGKLNKVRVKLKGETEFTEFVASITYNPKGQREIITYGNYTRTEYTYERETFRLTSLKTTRQTDNKELQDITYTYDPVGNITKIVDNSHDRVFNNNQVVEPEHKYTYDAIYRLIEANGREHVGLNVPDYYKNTESFKQSSFINLENTNDSNKLANYTRQYAYDKAGNLHRIQHIASDSFRSFTREIAVDQYTNRAILKESDDPINFNNYFDVNGNCIQLENIAALEWNYRDNISSAVVIQRETQPDDAEYYVYDAGGNRVRKVTERLINGNQLEVEEKIYLGGVEIKRISQQNSLIFERSSLHVMDDKKRIAIVHNWIQDDLNREVPTSDLNTNKTRYQFENHLGSASLELDGAGQIISYEEYFPYGGTSFIAGTNQAEVKLKEYRYSGKERDDTTGLYYYGARYYAPWLGRWMSCDPAGPKDSLNLLVFVNGNPIKFIDSEGLNLKDFFKGLIDKIKPKEDPDKLYGKFERGEWSDNSAIVTAKSKGSLKKLAYLITGNPEDWKLLGLSSYKVKKGQNIDVMPLINKLEENIRNNIVKATENYDASFPREGEAFMSAENLNEAQINAFFDSNANSIDVDCLGAGRLVQAKGLIESLKPGEYDKLGYSPQPNASNIITKTVSDISELRIGDKAYIENDPRYLEKHPRGASQGENVVKIGDDLFFGTGPYTEQKDKVAKSYKGWKKDLIGAFNRQGTGTYKNEKIKDVPGFSGTVWFYDVKKIAMEVFDLRKKEMK